LGGLDHGDFAELGGERVDGEALAAFIRAAAAQKVVDVELGQQELRLFGAEPEQPSKLRGFEVRSLSEHVARYDLSRLVERLRLLLASSSRALG
jgi:hypothetical protein